jgi:hypothetical protein
VTTEASLSSRAVLVEVRGVAAFKSTTHVGDTAPNRSVQGDARFELFE